MNGLGELVAGELTWAERARTYKLYLPNNLNPSVKRPLVMVLHGGAANADYAIRMAEMNPLADQHGFMIVYPNGTGVYQHAVLTWNAGRCCGWAHQHGIDDVGFLNALLTKLEAEYAVDASRVYVTGISNGAMMAYRLACELPDRIAAIAPVAGSLNYDGELPKQPVSVLHFHGTADQHAPYEGGLGSKTLYPREDRPVRESIQMWVRSNHCLETPQVTKTGTVTREVYGGGRDGSEVILVTLEGEGHTWPGGQPGIRNGNMDSPTQAIRATDLIWDFFSRHCRI